MKCPNCQFENKESATFCEKCGAQLISENKRMSFFERRQAKERERLYILSKSSLQSEDVKDIRDMDMGEVDAVPRASKSAMRKKTVAAFAASIVGVIVCVALIYLIGRLKFNDSLRVALILFVFLLCFTSAAFAIDYGYRMRMVLAMCKSDFAVKKISYGKPPVMLSGDTFYDLNIRSACDIPGCGAQMHIEEYNGEFIAVCNSDRSHLRRLDCALLNPLSTEKESASTVSEQAQPEISDRDNDTDNAQTASDMRNNGDIEGERDEVCHNLDK